MHIAENLDKIVILTFKSFFFKLFLVPQFQKFIFAIFIYAKVKHSSVKLGQKNFDEVSQLLHHIPLSLFG
jgi:hypothetical protein